MGMTRTGTGLTIGNRTSSDATATVTPKNVKAKKKKHTHAGTSDGRDSHFESDGTSIPMPGHLTGVDLTYNSLCHSQGTVP